ncbi:MAG: insulinase family protein, partial [Bacteroidota bacterium]
MNFKHTFFLSATVLLVTAGGAFAQVKKKPTPSPKSKPVSPAKQIAPQVVTQDLPTDPFLTKGTLPNGLTYYIRSTQALPKKAEMVLLTKAGSMVETDAQRGYGHLISHLALKGATDFNEDQLAGFLKLSKNNLKADSNIISSYDESVYRLTVRTDTADALNKGLNLLAGWAGNMTFDAAKVTAARTAALEELKSAGTVMKDRLDKA